MAMQLIYLGAAPDDKTGDEARIAGAKINENFTELDLRAPGVNVKLYGAIGDGSSHPASERYTTLAELQADYPFATALTDSLDWLGTQQAINLACTPGGPGAVYGPGGVYIMDHELVVPLPASNDSWRGLNQSLFIYGDGPTNTDFYWPDDLGADKYALRSDEAAPNGGISTIAMRVADLRLRGFGHNGGFGVSTFATNGWRMGTGCFADNAMFSGWHKGVVAWGNHNGLRQCTVTQNYYNLYFDNVISAGNAGDHAFLNTSLVGAMLASIGFGYNAGCDSATFASCHVGFAPYGLYKESTGGQGRTAPGLITNSALIDFAFEAVGNAAIYGENADDLIINLTMVGGGPGIIMDDNYYAAALGREALVKVGRISDCDFWTDFGWGDTYPKLAAAGALGLFVVNQEFTGVRFHRANNMLTLATTAVPAIKLTAANPLNCTWEIPGASGRFEWAGRAIAANDLLKNTPEGVGGGVEPMTATPGAVFAGVALTAGNSGAVVPVVTKGFRTIGKRAGVVIGKGALEVDPAAPTKVRGATPGSGMPLVGNSFWYPDTAGSTLDVLIDVVPSAVLLTKVNNQAGNYTLTAYDLGAQIFANAGVQQTITIPAEADVYFPTGAVVWVMQQGGGPVTIAPASGVALNSLNGRRNISGRYGLVRLDKTYINTWVLSGDLA